MDELERWNKVKQMVDKKSGDVFFKERDVWWTSLGQNIGHEENGKNEHFERPVIVLKRLDRNLFLGIPLTSKNRNQYYKLLVGRNGSISQYAIWTQIRVLSTRRLMRKEGVISKEYFMQLRAIIKAFL